MFCRTDGAARDREEAIPFMGRFMEPAGNLIGGKWTPACSGEMLAMHDPATGEFITKMLSSSQGIDTHTSWSTIAIATTPFVDWCTE